MFIIDFYGLWTTDIEVGFRLVVPALYGVDRLHTCECAGIVYQVIVVPLHNCDVSIICGLTGRASLFQLLIAAEDLLCSQQSGVVIRSVLTANIFWLLKRFSSGIVVNKLSK